MRRVFLLAGEASGDMHGAILARALRTERPDLEIWGVGGTRMREAGVRLLLRSEELSVVGLVEVFGRALHILSALETVGGFLSEKQIDLFVPIDYPDFNFRLLPRAYRLGIPIVYYISPQVWAWRPGRIQVLRRFIRRMIVIFPFEEALYRAARVPVTWVGHPLVDQIRPADPPAEERQRLGLSSVGPVVALLPGSRVSEVRRLGPLLRETRARVDDLRRQQHLPPVRWIIGQAEGLPAEALSVLEPASSVSGRRPVQREGGAPEQTVRLGGTDALRAADLALVASGTVTLEAALLGRPVLVVYRVNRLTYALARRLVRVEHIAMANLLAGRRLVPEFLQDEADPEAMARETLRLLADQSAYAEITRGLLLAREVLGPPGAPGRAARAVLEELKAP